MTNGVEGRGGEALAFVRRWWMELFLGLLAVWAIATGRGGALVSGLAYALVVALVVVVIRKARRQGRRAEVPDELGEDAGVPPRM